MTIRLLCALVWLYMGVRWAGPEAFVMAAWNIAPAAIAVRRLPLAVWLVVVWDAVVVVLGLLALPNYGTLHGGEFVSWAAVPAALELALGLFVALSVAAERR